MPARGPFQNARRPRERRSGDISLTRHSVSPGDFLRHTFIKFLIVAFCVMSASPLGSSPARARQGDATSFVYDEDGRLRAVLSTTGEAVVYEYDAAGNFTAIRRLTPDDLELLGFSPTRGPVGTLVTIFGTGFNQGVNSVSFNGAPATIVRSNLVSVVALVPDGATTGPVSVVTPRGTVNSTKPFVVRGVRLTPQAVTLAASETLLFGLTVSGTPSAVVAWTVNDAEGGTPSVGTITTSGLYTAPSLAGEHVAQFIVRATSVDDPELFGEALVTVVPFGGGSQFRSDGLSVRYGTPPNAPPTYVNGALSVRYGTPANTPPTYIDGALSVRYGTPANNTPTEVNGAVSATRGPVLTSLMPGTIARGASVTLTVSGLALNGASQISFTRLSNGGPEAGITFSNINVNAQGTSLTATVTVAGGVAVGTYVVVVTTPAGSTVRSDTATNLVQIN